ncbi:MAG: tetratricopeptide repeat protein [Rhodospirillales bacterium]|nr:tetratricopeptide repeat protein [Rhodospirillales bacterium]
MNRKERRRQEKAERQLKRGGAPADIAMQTASRHFQAGDLQKAAEVLEDFHRENPDHYGATHGLGVLYASQGDTAAAIPFLERACALNPDAADGHYNLGKAYQTAGRADDALAAYAQALEIDPGEVPSHLGIGEILRQAGDLDGAAWSFNKILEIDPDNDAVLTNLGAMLQMQGRLADAEAAQRKAVAINPANAVAHSNLGNVLHETERFDDAKAAYRRAIELAPDYPQPHHDLGLVLLLQGNLSEGWAEYEWRLQAEKRERFFAERRWLGQDLRGETILVWGEQGVGDEVMFASLVPDLIAAGANVILESDARLVPLYRRSFAEANCIAKDAAYGDIDYQVPSGSLAQYLRPDADAFPGGEAYLRPDEAKRDALRAKYKDSSGNLLVGIAWHSGNERSGPRKSMTLTDWAPLAGISGVTLIDLQYGDWAAERQAFEETTEATGTSILHDAGIDQMADLDAFAAQIAAMDVVISISNTTAHMAGALGVPVWVLLNTSPLSCWMLEGDDSPWYASARLVRQTDPDDWARVIERAAAELAKLAGARPKG